MRHASLEMNVVKAFLKFDVHIMNGKIEIRVQKIKVEKVNLEFMSPFEQLNQRMTVTLLTSLDIPNIQL